MVLTKRYQKINNIMGFADMKLYFLNSVAFVISLTEVEVTLKIILLICTIAYTIQKTRKIK
jgi:hypothetical protein